MSLRNRLLAFAMLAGFALGAAACSDITAPRQDCGWQGSQTSPCLQAGIQGSQT
jgi:hypothetical protein